jgi:hypothetical protein
VLLCRLGYRFSRALFFYYISASTLFFNPEFLAKLTDGEELLLNYESDHDHDNYGLADIKLGKSEHAFEIIKKSSESVKD